VTDSLVEILLVEDNPNDVELTLHALQRNNLANHVEVVRDGAEALQFIFGTGAYANRRGQSRPRVILLDLKLPKVDGQEVLRQVKSDPRTRTIPVVVLTSSREERDLVDSYNLGVNSYIVKPVAVLGGPQRAARRLRERYLTRRAAAGERGLSFRRAPLSPSRLRPLDVIPTRSRRRWRVIATRYVSSRSRQAGRRHRDGGRDPRLWRRSRFNEKKDAAAVGI
jgi:two-component system, response regulator